MRSDSNEKPVANCVASGRRLESAVPGRRSAEFFIRDVSHVLLRIQ